MKKLLILSLGVLLLVGLSQNSEAYSVTLTEFTGSDAEVQLNITGDGTNAVTFEVEVIKPLADLRAVFFNFDNLVFPSNLGVTDHVGNVTEWAFIEGGVQDLGDGATITPAGPFDAGIEIGLGGIGVGKGDYQYANFTITSDDLIDLGDFFGARLMSVELDENDPEYDPNDPRGGSSKLVGTYDPTNPAPVPEPASVLLLGLGVVGLAGLIKKQRKR